MSLNASCKIIKIMKDIRQLNILDDININKLFNKSNDQVQIDFIKFLVNKIEDVSKIPPLKISNINTFRVLLESSINFDEYNLCYFLLTNKERNIIITINEYNSYEKQTKNTKIASLLNEYKIKEAYNMELNYSEDDTSSESSESSESFDESFDESSESFDELSDSSSDEELSESSYNSSNFDNDID